MAALVLRRNVLSPYWSTSSLVATSVICRYAASTPNQEKLFERSAKNQQMGRPLTPSLQHLAQHPDWVWVLSFGHRASGVVTTAGVYGAALYYLTSSSSLPQIVDSVNALSLGPTTITVAKFCLALPLCYHFFDGMRHLTWNTGKGLAITSVVRLGLVVLTCALLTAGGFAMYTPAK